MASPPENTRISPTLKNLIMFTVLNVEVCLFVFQGTEICYRVIRYGENLYITMKKKVASRVQKLSHQTFERPVNRRWQRHKQFHTAVTVIQSFRLGGQLHMKAHLMKMLKKGPEDADLAIFLNNKDTRQKTLRLKVYICLFFCQGVNFVHVYMISFVLC